MTDGEEKSGPSDYERNDTGPSANSVPKQTVLGDEGPGLIAAGLSWTKSLIRDLDNDKTIPKAKHDLLRLYHSREMAKYKLRLAEFSHAEKIRDLESVIRACDGVSEAGIERSSAQEGLNEARSELQKASAALKNLRSDDAKWEMEEPSARKWRESRKWQTFTPEELQPAVDAIRRQIEHRGFWQANQSTMKLCFAALHPKMTGFNTASLFPYKRFLVALLGRQIDYPLLAPDRSAPVIFKAYLDLLETAMKLIVRDGFQKMFEIAEARFDLLEMHPVEWTKRQLDILISAEKVGIRLWIKQVCDPLDSSSSASQDDSIFWGNWRAPRFIHMQPAGNTCYDQASAWARENLISSEEFLEGRAERTTVFVRIDLSEVARAAEVEFAKRGAAKRQIWGTREGDKQTHVAPEASSLQGVLAPDFWRSIQDRFKVLAELEVTLAPPNSGYRWLRAYVDYNDKTKACGDWKLSQSIHENFRERFEVEATRAGIALGSDLTGDPLALWLHHVFFDLLKHNSKLLFAATEEGGVVVRVCEASALYCARLEKQALIEGRNRPVATDDEKSNFRSAPTPPASPQKGTLLEAVIRKVQNPQQYKSLTIHEVAAYFEVEPRTIYRWMDDGDLRRGVRRGSATIESVIRLEKQRARKPRNR